MAPVASACIRTELVRAIIEQSAHNQSWDPQRSTLSINECKRTKNGDDRYMRGFPRKRWPGGIRSLVPITRTWRRYSKLSD